MHDNIDAIERAVQPLFIPNITDVVVQAGIIKAVKTQLLLLILISAIHNQLFGMVFP